MEIGQIRTRTIEMANVGESDNRLLISSHNFNEVYLLDLVTDSISHKVFQSAITQNSRKVPTKTTFDSPQEMGASFKDRNEQVGVETKKKRASLFTVFQRPRAYFM